jgi:protoporphyrinogen oxidase
LYRLFFEDYTEKLWGIHPSNISPDWGAQRVKELSIGKVIVETICKIFNKNHTSNMTSLIDRFIYPKNGSGEFWETMAKKIEEMGGIIRLNSKVVAVKADKGKIEGITIKKADNTTETICGDLFFSTMPVKDLTEAMPPDIVPPDIYRIANTLPYRDLIVVGLLVKKLQIKNTTRIKTVNNQVPDCWFYIQERDVKLGRMQITNNLSPYLVADNTCTVGLGLEYFCNENDAMWRMSPEDFIQYAINELVKIEVIKKEDVLDSMHCRVKKAYPAYFGSYSQFDKVQVWLDAFDNLYCIGRNGQHRYNNMDHSMLTAIEAVNLIKSGKKDKSVIWSVNTENEYHEEKQSYA